VLVTVYVPGISLLELRMRGPLPPVVVARLGRELALALSAVHAAADDAGRPLGIVHRDVTAANCLVGADGRTRLIDLGIARSIENRAHRTESGLLRGTLRYLAPELFDGGRYAPLTDLWSLGVVLWEALLGRSAVVGSDAVAISHITSGLIMRCDVGESPDPVVTRAIRQLLENNPTKRLQTAKEAAALFSMVERSLSADAGAVTALIARLVAGDPVAGTDDAVARLLREASRVFRAEEFFSGARAAKGATTDVRLEDVVEKTDAPDDAAASALRSYAVALASMERADSLWRAERGALPPLPPTMVRETLDDGATVELRLPQALAMKDLAESDQTAPSISKTER
jgi:serine/threonine-protein kinase